MINLKQLFKNPLQKTIPNSVIIFLLVIALVGFIDAGYLTVEHYQGSVPPCFALGECDSVLTSPYAEIFGIPLSLFGLVYYFLVLLGVFAYFESKKIIFLKLALLVTIAGLLASLWFIYLQVFVIHSYCTYCLGSALSSILLFTIAMEIFGRYQE